MPLAEILVGVALDTVAVPPVIDKVKSLASNDPVPPTALNTTSSRVTVIVLLSAARVTPVIVGGT